MHLAALPRYNISMRPQPGDVMIRLRPTQDRLGRSLEIRLRQVLKHAGRYQALRCEEIWRLTEEQLAEQNKGDTRKGVKSCA